MAENNFKQIEEKWQKFWEATTAKDDSNKLKKYILVEFPYPSGSGLHVGHAFSFTGGDVYARYQRMKGYEVLFPMGWDAFGLPTENYAIKMKRKPQEVTKENTDMFRLQMKRLAFSFDWAREINTTDPQYYKWTQWIFVQLFRRGLAYKKEMPINWCPSCKIGLANEEVVNGKCERCGAGVSRRNISQWIVKITDYADKLIDGLGETKFIEKVKQSQINWIGKSEGAMVKFQISNDKCLIKELEVFTTRPDTLPGVTFMVVAPEHRLVNGLKDEKVVEYIRKTRSKSDLERAELQKEKTGVFSGLYAINPINNQEIPIWISDFVLSSYGTGAIMAVPAHDDRDHAFANKFDLPIVPVVSKDGWNFKEKAYIEVEKGEKFEKMMKLIEEKGIGKRSTSYHLRDWIFSRQHYWGEPIPMINCPKDGWVPVPEDQLPVLLPEVKAYEPTDDGQSPLSKIDSFVNCKCPVCGGEARRETDTMPNWAGSDWYFLSYVFADQLPSFAKASAGKRNIFMENNERLNKWMPVDVYIGGDEHNTLHLLYSRFIYKFLVDIGAVPESISEPYRVRMSHGIILGSDNQRMSKSKGNAIVPEVVADKYGVDVLRMYLMFIGPFDGTMVWNENTLMGVKRFLDRVKNFTLEQIKNNFVSQDKNGLVINQLIKGVGEDLDAFGFNTAIAKLMKAINDLKTVTKEEMKTILKLLAPLAPYMAEELWSSFAGASEGYKSVHLQSWPEVNRKCLEVENIKVPVAINGKTRIIIEVLRGDINNREKILNLVYSNEKLRGYLSKRKVIREIMVPGKMVNLVI
ncbi:MAG: leucine--tRNA ligase [Patescibacteria group bacterium]